jgi:carbon monoxide dehydrogenase subunit G
MPEYERSGPVNAKPDAVFAFLSDIRHLPEYIPDMVLARAEGDRLRVAADVEGRHEEGTASFKADSQQRRIDWGAAGTAGYGGWLQVSASDPGSTVTIHLSTDRASDDAQIQASLSQALANISDWFASG